MEKKPAVILGDWLSEDGVFTLSTTVNYNGKIVMYERGIVKTEIIDGKEVNTQNGIKYQAKGDYIAERAYNYLLECGLTNEQLDNIRDTFLA